MIPSVTFAFLAAFGESCLAAMMGYVLNVVDMSVFQFITMRIVSEPIYVLDDEAPELIRKGYYLRHLSQLCPYHSNTRCSIWSSWSTEVDMG